MKRELKENSSIENQLRCAKIWLSPETDKEGSEIQAQIKRLLEKKRAVQQEWSDCL